jgi:Cyanate lyase C-terminal domain
VQAYGGPPGPDPFYSQNTEPRMSRAEVTEKTLSAIDFTMNITREAGPKGNRVKITMSGKFLPYKTY